MSQKLMGILGLSIHKLPNCIINKLRDVVGGQVVNGRLVDTHRLSITLYIHKVTSWSSQTVASGCDTLETTSEMLVTKPFAADIANLCSSAFFPDIRLGAVNCYEGKYWQTTGCAKPGKEYRARGKEN